MKSDVLKKKLNVEIVTTKKMKRHSHGHGTKDLRDIAEGHVQVKIPDITGKTSPPWKYGIIHSKLMIADK